MSDNQPVVQRPRRWALILAVAVLAATALGAVVVAGAASASRRPAAAAVRPAATHAGQRSCSASGCAVVSLTRTVPTVTVYYGASCTGVNGAWFFNAVVGGGNDQLRPSYALRWSFTPGQTSAKPSGQVQIPPTGGTQAALTVSQGTLNLTGTRKPNVKVTATGTLAVQLSGSPTNPVLTFTETGLAKGESALGLRSPFDDNGHPLSVPVKSVKTMAGC